MRNFEVDTLALLNRKKHTINGNDLTPVRS